MANFLGTRLLPPPPSPKRPNVQTEHFERMLAILDRLHDAAFKQELSKITTLDAEAVIGWLDDVMFVCEETIKELKGA
jgi:hypothetical protein